MIAYLYRPQTLRVLGTARRRTWSLVRFDRRPARLDPDEQDLQVTRGPSDQELVRRLRAGDTGAWDVLDRRYRAALERFARRMLHDVAPDQVEDVVQEALWRAHRALQRDTRVLELRPWLYRLTRNCCLDERARVRTDAVELERAADVADRADGPAAIRRAPRRAAHAARRPRPPARAPAPRAAAARARRPQPRRARGRARA